MVPGALVEGNETGLHAVVSYTCKDTLRHLDGLTTNNITCLATGRWSVTKLSCGGIIVSANYANCINEIPE